ncbi:MAG: hydroxymethylbilane synthase [Pseudomonadota bacterium]
MSIKPRPIASRRSPLAMAQSRYVQNLLATVAGISQNEKDEAFPIKAYVTSGDKNMAPSLSEEGGKGLFTKEVEEAVLNEQADIAVHSMKDMPAQMPEGLVIAAIPVREDPRDAFVTVEGISLQEMPEGSRIGTSAVRRAAQLKRLRPDLEIVPMRGNVGTRLDKLAKNQADGTFLAEAGLRRLGHDTIQREVLETSLFLPALGQGTLCIQARQQDEETLELCSKINCNVNPFVSASERAFLSQLDGSCRTPIAGFAHMAAGSLTLTAEILDPEGQETVRGVEVAAITTLEEASQLGVQLAEQLKAQASPALLDLWMS